MGLMIIKKLSIFFLIISGSLLSTSFAGRRSKLINNLTEDVDSIQEGGTQRKTSNEEEVRQERLLRANTRDYGRYDPTPALSKPPFKLIPN